jgi:hypothetical protein
MGRQEGQVYPYTRGLINRFLTFIPCSQSERNGSKVLAATLLSLYKSTYVAIRPGFKRFYPYTSGLKYLLYQKVNAVEQ